MKIKSSHLITVLILINTDIIDTLDGTFTLVPTVNDRALMDISCKIIKQLGIKNYIYCASICMVSSTSTPEVCGAVRYDKDSHVCTLCHVCKDDGQTTFVAFQNSTNMIWTRNKGKYVYFYIAITSE